ncbi:MAG: 3-oxoacyl-ACP reductase [Alphaproteobacteria bacterium]|nr:MAG: 3-oxoacyl-ACP reductase [Alphaproteobacteria bacterium]
MNAYDFSGKVAFVSGAGRGFGRRAAEMLAKGGARLVVTDHTDELVNATVSTLAASGAEICGLSGDIAVEETSEKLAALIAERHGHLDLALNNAGIAQPQVRLHETESRLAERVIAVDLMGVFYAMKHQIPLMLSTVERTGSQCAILNVASAAGLMGSPKLAAYSAAKAGVIGLTRTAAVEYGRKGIRVNCICPSFTKTEMVTAPLETSPHGREKAEANMVAFNPMQRLGEIDEVVDAMLWALSPANSFFNGQALSIDGGLSA